MTTTYLILFILIIAVIAAVTKILVGKILPGRHAGREPVRFHYEKNISLFTAAERAFFIELEQAAGDGCRIFGKIRLADVIKVGSGLSGGEQQSAFNRIQGKHVDFLICRRDDLSIVGAVELDDRKGRDSSKNRALEAAGIAVLHWPLKRKSSTAQLAEKLSETFGPAIPGTPGWSHLFTRGAEYNPDGRSGILESAGDDQAKDCPACGGKLEKYRVKRGRHAGRLVLVCAGYPECKYIKPYRDKEKTAGETAGPALDPAPAEEPTDAEPSRPRFRF